MDDEGLAIDYQSIGRNGTVRLTARLPGGQTFTDKVDVADANGRARFLRGLCKGRKGIDRKAVGLELDRIAGHVVTRPKEECKDREAGDGKSSQADALVALAKKADLFHTPGGHDSEGYATVEIHGHKETWPISSKGFKRWLSRLYWEKTEKAPGSQSLQDALNVIAGMAIHDGAEHVVSVRIAEDSGIWLDLADEKWQAVQITAAGWKIVADPPIRFVRRRGMLALPVPVQGGSLDELRGLVNLPDDGGWMLFVAWLVAALRPGRPFPVLCVNGEQGSAKSTLCRMGRALVDPNQAPLRRPPREERDLMIAATNGWIVAFDNLSGIPAPLSDALCTLATGGGFSTRELYTDNDEKLFDAIRPVMLNGIEDLATRPDLLDRSINLTLPVIPDENRRDEDELYRHFEVARPRILGALLNAVSKALRNRGQVKLPIKPRMADFACWVVASEPALPWPAGKFLNAYTENRGAANALALEASIIAPAILSFIANRPIWQGTAGELLNELEGAHTDERTRKRQEWPKSARKLSGELRRLAPNFRRAGLDVVFGARTKRGTPITLESIGKRPSPPTPPSQNKAHTASSGEDCEAEPSPCNGLSSKLDDGGDGDDDVFRDESSAEKMNEWMADAAD